MGLIGKKIKKATMPENIIFEHFMENRTANKKRIDADCKKFKKDFSAYMANPYVRELQGDFHNFNEDMRAYLFSATGSEIFSNNLVAMSNVAKWHAAFYIYTDKAKTVNEVENAYANLRKLYDIMIFITMDHVMNETGENIAWDEGFMHIENTKNEELILMMTEVLNNIVMLAEAMCDGDRASVLGVLQFFSDENYYKLQTPVEDIFEL